MAFGAGGFRATAAAGQTAMRHRRRCSPLTLHAWLVPIDQIRLAVPLRQHHRVVEIGRHRSASWPVRVNRDLRQ
jgi:hypothetical protein